jgi:hypothetical protein
MRALGTHVAVCRAMATHATEDAGTSAIRITQLRFSAGKFSSLATLGPATVGSS